MLMAAKPTPSVMPRKYFPSRVNLSLRGGRKRRTSRCQSVPPPERPKSVAWEMRVSEMRDERTLGGRDEGGGFEVVVRGADFVAIGRGRLERDGDAGDDLAHGPFGFVARRHVALGVRRQAHAVREDGHGELVDVVGDAVQPAAQKGAGPGGA